MRTRVLIVGGGGHAAVIADAAAIGEADLVGVLDDQAEPALADPAGFGVPRLGPTSELPERVRSGGANAFDGWILGIGDVGLRRRLLNRARLAEGDPVRAATLVHPRAIVARSAALGRGVFVGPGAVINARARVGDHAIINSGAIVEHDNEIGENTHVAPGAALAGYAAVGRDTLIGMGSRVLPGVRVGSHAVVAAGAVVRHPVADWTRVAGVPARSMDG